MRTLLREPEEEKLLNVNKECMMEEEKETWRKRKAGEKVQTSRPSRPNS